MTIAATIQKNGIKQTWHTIEFSNNHTHPTTTPQTRDHHQAAQQKRFTRCEPHQTGAEHNTKQHHNTMPNQGAAKSITDEQNQTAPHTDEPPYQTTRSHVNSTPCQLKHTTKQHPQPHTAHSQQKPSIGTESTA